MVRLRGPGLAQTAAGGLGQTLIFSQSKGRAYCKRWAAPANPKTPGQLAVRACTQFISQQWQAFSPAEHASWEELARQTNIPPYNACLAYNLSRARNYKAPTAWYPADATGTDPTFTSPVLVAKGRQAKLAINVSAVNDGLTFVFYHCTNASYTRAWNRIIRYLDIPTPTLLNWYFGPFTTGPHYFSIDYSMRRGKTAGAVYNRTITIA